MMEKGKRKSLHWPKEQCTANWSIGRMKNLIRNNKDSIDTHQSDRDPDIGVSKFEALKLSTRGGTGWPRRVEGDCGNTFLFSYREPRNPLSRMTGLARIPNRFPSLYPLLAVLVCLPWPLSIYHLCLSVIGYVMFWCLRSANGSCTVLAATVCLCLLPWF